MPAARSEFFVVVFDSRNRPDTIYPMPDAITGIRLNVGLINPSFVDISQFGHYLDTATQEYHVEVTVERNRQTLTLTDVAPDSSPRRRSIPPEWFALHSNAQILEYSATSAQGLRRLRIIQGECLSDYPEAIRRVPAKPTVYLSFTEDGGETNWAIGKNGVGQVYIPITTASLQELFHTFKTEEIIDPDSGKSVSVVACGIRSTAKGIEVIQITEDEEKHHTLIRNEWFVTQRLEDDIRVVIKTYDKQMLSARLTSVPPDNLSTIIGKK